MMAEYDPKDPLTNADPIPILRSLQEKDPVHWSKPLRGWVVTRYEDVKRVQTDRALSADRLTPFFEHQPLENQNKIRDLIRYLNTWVAFKDPPEHTRLRALMSKVLTPGKAERLRPNIEEIVDHLLTGLEKRPSFDFISDFANPLPAAVIMDLLGVPRTDLDKVKVWSDKIQLFIGSATMSENKYELAQEGALEMAGYFKAIIADREQNPGDDMVSALLAIRDEDQALTEDEVIGTCILLLFAGHETTTNLIGNGTRALMRHPEQLAKLMADPGLNESAVEEMLRYDGPTGGLVRVVKVEHKLHGKTLKQGDRVFAMINAANHDPRKFEHPEIFDIERNPNPHLTFNFGIHYCLGAQIARLEGQIAIREAFRRFPNLRLAVSDVTYMDTLVMRGTRFMPVLT
jgi:cytochrome P450